MTDRTDNTENTALNMAVPEAQIDGKRTDVNGENTVNEPYRIYMPNEKISESLINGYSGFGTPGNSRPNIYGMLSDSKVQSGELLSEISVASEPLSRDLYCFCSQSAFRSQFGFAMARFRNMCIMLFC